MTDNDIFVAKTLILILLLLYYTKQYFSVEIYLCIILFDMCCLIYLFCYQVINIIEQRVDIQFLSLLFLFFQFHCLFISFQFVTVYVLLFPSIRKNAILLPTKHLCFLCDNILFCFFTMDDVIRYLSCINTFNI